MWLLSAVKPPGPFNHVKSSLLGSTSESNINKYSTIHKIPLIALNFTEGADKKTHSPPTSEKTIIAPKVKDRTHNVTEKVTQVSGEVFTLVVMSCVLWHLPGGTEANQLPLRQTGLHYPVVLGVHSNVCRVFWVSWQHDNVLMTALMSAYVVTGCSASKEGWEMAWHSFTARVCQCNVLLAVCVLPSSAVERWH